MKINFLGTSGWYSTKIGNTICTLIESKDYFIILDAGDGIYKIDKYIKTKKPIFLFLSHLHFDHIIGLHILSKFNFSSDVQIYTPKGTASLLRKLINPPFTTPFLKLSYKVKIFEISKKNFFLPFSVKTKFLLHSPFSLGYRFEIEGKKIAYCLDTDVCKNLLDLSKNVDLLITECNFKPRQKSKIKRGHLTPEEAAKVAKNAGVKKLVLTHFGSNFYMTLKQRKEAEKIAKTIFKNTIAAFDDLEILL